MIRSEFALEAVITSFTAARAIVSCFTVGSVRNCDEPRERAELLRPVLAELAGLPARAIARELTARGVPLRCDGHGMR